MRLEKELRYASEEELACMIFLVELFLTMV